MALSDECQALTIALSGLGVEESSLISILGKWHPDHKKTFRKQTHRYFSEDDRHFEKSNEDLTTLLENEFLRFHRAVLLCTMHPWERDARFINAALTRGPGPASYGLIIEIACTRSSEELLGARRAYHSLFDHSIEEDVASRLVSTTPERKLLVALVSSYRYEGRRVDYEIAKSEARLLQQAILQSDLVIENEEEVVRILSTRSKLHLKDVLQHYNEITGHNITEDLPAQTSLKTTIQCLCTPEAYFSEILEASLREDADGLTQDALTRVIVSQADVNLKHIVTEYQNLYGVSLQQKIKDRARGNFRDFLLSLFARRDASESL